MSISFILNTFTNDELILKEIFYNFLFFDYMCTSIIITYNYIININIILAMKNIKYSFLILKFHSQDNIAMIPVILQFISNQQRERERQRDFP
jgi:hypothetical protein